jgi:hypothetical protein
VVRLELSHQLAATVLFLVLTLFPVAGVVDQLIQATMPLLGVQAVVLADVATLIPVVLLCAATLLDMQVALIPVRLPPVLVAVAVLRQLEPMLLLLLAVMAGQVGLQQLPDRLLLMLAVAVEPEQ